MKAYNEYMDNISVSGALHRRFASCVSDAKSLRRRTGIRRYVAVLACLAVILSGTAIISHLPQMNVLPVPGKNPPVSKSNASISSSGASGGYEPVFNKADRQLSKDIAIPGHFWQELTSAELQKVYPGLSDTYAIKATANFKGDGTLYKIDADAVSADGCKAYIQVATGEVSLDYVLESQVRISDILGTKVTAGCFETKPNSRGQRNIIYFASFKLCSINYYVESGGKEAEKEELKNEIIALIDSLINGGAADLSVLDNPEIPELREDALNLNEARADVDFGAYLPRSLPSGFAFESAMRFINQEQNYLSVLWTKGMGSIQWRISTLGEEDKVRITSVDDKENYDLSLYPIPRADSVPDQLREIVDNPIFRSEDLTLDVIRTRSYEVSDEGDEPGCRMNFGVLYKATLVEINVKGATPEDIFRILRQIKK